MTAALLRELRARGLELRAEGTRLRVFGPPGAYSTSVRAQLLACKRELLEQLREEAIRTAATYDSDERAWASEYAKWMALGRGFDPTLAQLAADILAKAPARASFQIERDRITIGMGEGREVCIHREPHPWLTAQNDKEG